MTKDLGASSLNPETPFPTNEINHNTSITESPKMLTKTAGELKVNVVAISAIHPTTHTPTPMSYASIATSNTQTPPNLTTFNPNVPEYITHIENKLRIQDRQVYIIYDQNTEDSPKDPGSAVAYKLCSKMNKWMCSLDQETSQVSHMASHLIKTLHFTNWSTILIECDSNTMASQLRGYLKNKNLLTCICSTAKSQPHMYCLVMKFIPCNGTFLPHNESHLHSLEEVHRVEEGSIITAAWIKKPEMRLPNQKMANLKVICSSPQTANHLLLE